MKKTVFKGTINGEEFDSVQDYNTKMSQLLAAGSPINAHADTSTIETECCPCENCSEDVMDFRAFLPGIDRDLNKLKNPPYGSYTSPNDTSEKLMSMYNDVIIPAIDDMSESELRSYKKAVDNIFKAIIEDLDIIHSKYEVSTNKLRKIGKSAVELLKDMRYTQKELSEIKFNQSIGEIYAGLYEKIQKSITNQLELEQREQDVQDSGEETEQTSPCTQNDVSFATAIDGLKKLCDEIFD